MKDEEEVQKLIALKRYETPGDAYYEQFLENFKERQRSEMLRQSSRALLAERISTWFGEVNGTKWLAPAGAVAVAAVAGVFISGPGDTENSQPSALVVEETAEDVPVAGDEDFEIDLPKPDQRVPEFGTNISGGAVPVSLREL